VKIGLIGLGNIGQHFATRLLEAGHELVVYDTRPDAVARFVRQGAQAAGGAAENAA